MNLVPSVYQRRSGPGPEPAWNLIPNGGTNGSHDVFHRSFDPETDSPVAVVTEAVSVIQNTDVFELPPLTTALDADALEELLTRAANEPEGVVEVRFVYGGFEIIMKSTGDMWLRWEEDTHG